MTNEQITHILGQIDINREDLPFIAITCGFHVNVLDLNSATIEVVYTSPQLLKITSFDGMLEDAVLYIDLKSIDSIALSRKEP